MELYNSAKRPQKLFVWKELCQATKLCCSNTTLKNKYNCIICVWHGMEPEKHVLEILVQESYFLKLSHVFTHSNCYKWRLPNSTI